MRSIWAFLVCFIAASQALVVQPARLPCVRPAVQRTASPTMLLSPAPLDALDVVTASASTALPATLLLSDVVEQLQGFGGSPLILLLPIGVGTLVASGIIYVLVKSAG